MEVHLHKHHPAIATVASRIADALEEQSKEA
eukprot:SAG31_NODE_10066_length_1188_cov_1.440771_3_plen_30_part_01